jgi:hypothetical protein
MNVNGLASGTQGAPVPFANSTHDCLVLPKFRQYQTALNRGSQLTPVLRLCDAHAEAPGRTIATASTNEKNPRLHCPLGCGRSRDWGNCHSIVIPAPSPGLCMYPHNHGRHRPGSGATYANHRHSESFLGQRQYARLMCPIANFGRWPTVYLWRNGPTRTTEGPRPQRAEPGPVHTRSRSHPVHRIR